ncbi:MAG: cupin domain-containing protein [Candidatus Thermoplasmatota archaeon]|jgi:quercetin dioxygenase-like cupin family protein|nr:cupin domain-containing protein [Candidatus Thermoplasmatota archaeon]
MKVSNADEAASSEVRMDGVTGTSIQWLASKTDGAPNFAMRRFTMAPGGTIPLHDHPWEHEIYILQGKGTALYGDRKVDIASGDVIFIPGNEPHGYINDGKEDLVFLCMIPNSGDPR